MQQKCKKCDKNVPMSRQNNTSRKLNINLQEITINIYNLKASLKRYIFSKI